MSAKKRTQANGPKPTVPASTEFKLLFTTSTVNKQAKTVATEDEQGDGEPIDTVLSSHGKPSAPTVVTFKDRRNADNAHDAVLAYNMVSTDVSVHVVKLYI